MFTTETYQGEAFTQAEADLCNEAVRMLMDLHGYTEERAIDLVANRFIDGVTLEQLTKK